MRTITVKEKVAIPHPKWIDPREHQARVEDAVAKGETPPRLATCAQLMEFKPGTFQVEDWVADAYEAHFAPPAPHVDVVTETSEPGPERAELKAKKG